MDSDLHSQIRLWPFGEAPQELRALFPKGRDDDWVVHVQERELVPVARHSLLRWRPVFPVIEAPHPAGGVVYWGAETLGLEALIESRELELEARPVESERRRAPRVPLDCSIRYVTQTEAAGIGHTIDLSANGISFSTEAHLSADDQVTLHIAWPIRLEGDVPVELRASGRLVRTEVLMAAMELGSMSFSIAG
jgi:hypothetical protein